MAGDETPKDGQPDRTVVRPMPGGKRGQARKNRAQAKQAAEEPAADRTVIAPKQSARADARARSGPVRGIADLDEAVLIEGTNLVLSKARVLLGLSASIRRMTRHDNPEQLHASILKALETYRADLHNSGVNRRLADTAQYIIAALIDESVLTTPWGADSTWAGKSLAQSLFSEAIAGERFYAILEEALEQRERTVDLLELIHAALAIGFEGKYAVTADGPAEREALRKKTYLAIREMRGDPPADLSGKWQGSGAGRPKAAKIVPLWVAGAGAAVVMVFGYTLFSLWLAGDTSQAYAKVAALGRAAEPVAAERAPEVGLIETLRQTLAEEITSGWVAVAPDPRGGARVTLKGQGLFRSGSAVVSSERRDLLERLGGVLADRPGAIVIEGHTDNIPINTLRFPSNYELASGRAESVRKLIVRSGDARDKYKVVAKAESEPIADNTTAEGRALNRRIEIIIPYR